MRSFEELVNEALAADASGWGFSWLDGRATEERPSWGFAGLLAERLADADVALDIDTGGGEVLGEAAWLPRLTVATESWAPNVVRAREHLGRRGVHVVGARGDELPFAADTFDLVTSRHPIRPAWSEIARVLAPSGRYFAQHVGPASAFELIEYFLGPLPEYRRSRDPQAEVAEAQDAGLSLVDLRTARCRMEFFDVGSIVWILRKCPWWVPDFSVARYRERLAALDDQLRSGEPFIAHSTRHLIHLRLR